MENLKNIAPIEDFNWEAYENGEALTGMSQEELEKAYLEIIETFELEHL